MREQERPLSCSLGKASRFQSVFIGVSVLRPGHDLNPEPCCPKNLKTGRNFSGPEKGKPGGSHARRSGLKILNLGFGVEGSRFTLNLGFGVDGFGFRV